MLDRNGRPSYDVSMFDAHRHPTLQGKMHHDALYCTAEQDQWPMLDLLEDPAFGAIGCLFSSPIPPLEDLYDYLRVHPALQVGEIGLDRRFADIEEQKAFFVGCLEMAFELNRSMTIHIVGETGLLLRILGKEAHHLPPLLWHNYTGSVETAREAARYGCIVSLGRKIGRTKVAERLGEIADLPLAVETDYGPGDDERSYEAILERHYVQTAMLLHLDRETLREKSHASRTILENGHPPR